MAGEREKDKGSRPKAFDFFEEGRSTTVKKGPRERFRLVFKYLSYLIISFLLIISLVGCIQPFFINISSKVGTGFEMYRRSKDVSPYVAVLKYDDKERMYGVDKEDLRKAANFYLSSSQEGESVRDVNQKLIKQSEGDGGVASWKAASERVAVQLVNGSDGAKNIYSVRRPDGESLYLAKTSNQSDYKPLTTFTDIKVFEVKYIGDRGKVKEGTFNSLKTYILRADTKLDSSNSVFARDIIEVLTKETMARLSEEFGGSFSEAYSLLERSKRIDPGKGEPITLTPRQIEAINYYNNAVTTYLTRFFFFASPGVTDAKKSGDGEGTVNPPKESGENNETNNPLKLNVREDRSQGTYDIIYVPPANVDNAVPLNPNYPQESYSSVVTSWGESWGYGPFYAMFVWPIFLIVDSTISLSDSWGGWGVVFAIVMVVIITKLIQFLFTFKSIFSQFKLEEIKPKKAKIEAKYEPYKGNKMMMLKKQQEIMELHKKHNIKPYAMFLQLIITAPVLLSVWRVFTASPEIKSASVIGIHFSEISYSALFSGNVRYLLPIILSMLIQLTSQLLPKFLRRKQMKFINVYEKEALRKQNRTANIMSFVFVFIGFFFQAGIQFYWSITGLWMIMQNLFVHYFQKTNFFKEKVKPRL